MLVCTTSVIAYPSSLLSCHKRKGPKLSKDHGDAQWGRTESQLIMFSLSSDTIPATKANDTVWMFNKQSRHIMPKSWQLRKTVPLLNPLIRQVAAFRRSRASSHKPFCSSYRFVRQWYQWCQLSYAPIHDHTACMLFHIVSITSFVNPPRTSWSLRERSHLQESHWTVATQIKNNYSSSVDQSSVALTALVLSSCKNSAKGRVSKLSLASVCLWILRKLYIISSSLGCQLRYCLSLEAVIVCSLQIFSESLCSTTNHWKKTNAKYPERWGHHPASNLLWRSFPRSVVWPRHGHPIWLSIPPGYGCPHDSSARSESGPASPWERFVGNMEGWSAKTNRWSDLSRIFNR